MVSRSRSLIVLLPLVALSALACPGVVSAAPTLVTRDVLPEVNGLGWGSAVSQDKREVRFYRLPNPTPTVVQAGEGCEFLDSYVRYGLRWCGAQGGNRLEVVNVLTGTIRSLPTKWVADGRCANLARIMSDYWLVVPLTSAGGFCMGATWANWRTGLIDDTDLPWPADVRGPVFRRRGWMRTTEKLRDGETKFVFRFVWGTGRTTPALFSHVCCRAAGGRTMASVPGFRQAWWSAGTIRIFTEKSGGRPIARYRTPLAETGPHHLAARALPDGMFLSRAEASPLPGRYTGTWWVPRNEVGY